MKEVAAIAILNDHHILMGRRRESGKWTNPGGHLNPGEKPLDGAVREVREETGINLNPKNLVHMETRIVKKPSGEKIKVHGYKVHLQSKPSTSMKIDPDEEVQRWVWVKLDLGLAHIKDELHVPLGDNVLLSNLFKGDIPVKRHTNKFWKSARKFGKDAFDDLTDKLTKEGPQQYLQRKDHEKSAAEIIRGGKADWMKDDRFSDKQLRMGVSIEKEHTKNPRLAKEIAKDHLVEDKNYYTHLKEMEDKYVEKKAFWSGFEKAAKEEGGKPISPYAYAVPGGAAAGTLFAQLSSPHPAFGKHKTLTPSEEAAKEKAMAELKSSPTGKKIMAKFHRSPAGLAYKADRAIAKIKKNTQYLPAQKQEKAERFIRDLKAQKYPIHPAVEKDIERLFRSSYKHGIGAKEAKTIMDDLRKNRKIIDDYVSTPEGKKLLNAKGELKEIKLPPAYRKELLKIMKRKHRQRLGLGAAIGLGAGALAGYSMT